MLAPLQRTAQALLQQDPTGQSLILLRRTLRALMMDSGGQGLVEYALIIALVSIVAIACLQVLGQKASNSLSNAAALLS